MSGETARRLHALISRFNWPHRNWSNQSRQAYEIWLDRRLQVFKSVTVRSIQNCYVKPDLWLILGADDPVDIGATIEHAANASGVRIRFCAYSGQSMTNTIREALHEELTRPREIMTTRMDTDDVVSSDFFARLRTVTVDRDRAVRKVGVTFPGGANIDMTSGDFFYSAYPNNPFISLIEHPTHPEEFESVMSFSHVDLNILPSVIHLRSFHPMWASCIHDDNLANQSLSATNRQPLLRQPALLQRFGLQGRWPDA